MASIETFDVRGVAGIPIVLPIGGGPATGHHWTLDLPPGVRQISDSEPEPHPDERTRLGGASGSRLRVLAEAGEHLVTARLARPWERNAIREVRLELHVDEPGNED